MSLPSIFEYMPEQARELCKMAEAVEPGASTGQKLQNAAKVYGTGLLGFAS